MAKETEIDRLNTAIVKSVLLAKPPERITVSEWADKYRRLPRSNAESGAWRTSRTPYLKEPMDAFTDPKVRRIVMVAASQVGKSEFELNCIGTLLAAKRTSRTEKVMFTPDQLAQVTRFTTFPHQAVESSGKIFSWTAALLIPFRLIGIDPAALPVSLRGNFYKCGDKTAHPHYLSWNPIKTPKPDFHRPEFFGELLIH